MARSRKKKNAKATDAAPVVAEETRTIVQVRPGGSEPWTQDITMEVISRFGGSFDLDKPCNVGQLVTICFPPSVADDVFGRSREPLLIVCLIQQCSEIVERGRSVFKTEVMFVGENIPPSYDEDPTQTYSVCGTDENGFFKIIETEKPFRARRHPRFPVNLELNLLHIQKLDRTILRAVGITRNVSVAGISIVSTLDAEIGDKIKVNSRDIDFYAIAVVRNRRSLIGIENLLHLEFLEANFPIARALALEANGPPTSETEESYDNGGVRPPHTIDYGDSSVVM